MGLSSFNRGNPGHWSRFCPFKYSNAARYERWIQVQISTLRYSCQRYPIPGQFALPFRSLLLLSPLQPQNSAKNLKHHPSPSSVADRFSNIIQALFSTCFQMPIHVR